MSDMSEPLHWFTITMAALAAAPKPIRIEINGGDEIVVQLPRSVLAPIIVALPRVVKASACRRDVLEVLEAARGRLTQTQIQVALAGKTEWSVRHIARTLAALVKNAVADHDSDSRPPGYAVIRRQVT